MSITSGHSDYIVTHGPKSSSHSELKSHYITKSPSKPESIKAYLIADEEYQGGVVASCEDWIRAHDAPVQEAVSVVAKNVMFIDFDAFKYQLGESYADARGQLNGLYEGEFDSKKHVIVPVEGGKSNKWVAELALSEYGVQAFAYVRLGEKDARSFQDFCSDTMVPKLADKENSSIISRPRSPTQSAATEAFKDKTIMLFDDGSYSGMQLRDHLRGVLKASETYDLNLKSVCIIVPFATEEARKVLAEEAALSTTVKVIVSASHIIPSLANLDDQVKEIISQMWYNGDMAELAKRGLVWFSHKVPNSQSFPAALINGSIYKPNGQPISKSIRLIPQVIPPYKNEGSPLQQVDLPNFHKLGNRLCRGGQPTLEGFKKLKELYQVNTIINLREVDEYGSQELQAMGFIIINLPTDPEFPLPEHHIQVFSKECENKDKKIFVHCYHGSDRTGALIAAYQVIKKVPASQVISQMLDPKFGFHRLTHGHLIKQIEEMATSQGDKSFLQVA